MFPSDRFAAFLAHALNSSDIAVCTVEPGGLYALLLDALAGPYRDALLYQSTYRFRMSEEEAAAAYFKVTLERAFWLSNKVEMSIAHRLLLALCRRGVGGAWRAAELRREGAPADAPHGAVPLMAVGSFEAVTGRLARLSSAISSGNPAATIRQRKGPLWLLIGAQRACVPEEISPWDAVVSGPTVLQSLAPGEPFNKFCGLVIDVLRTANRPFQELLGLGRGICPFDWLDVLSTNQTRGLRLFLQEVAESGGADSLELWSRAWEKARVPGFRSAAELWDSDIGRALRAPPVREIDAAAVPGDAGGEILEQHEFCDRVALLVKSGALCEAEGIILERLYQGDTLAEVAEEPAVQRLLAARGLTFPALIADLQTRIHAGLRTLERT